MVYAIILAAGSGERFNKSPIKPLFLIKHKPLFLHSLDTFLSSNKIDQILLVINKKHQSSFSKYLKALKYKKVLICYGDSSARYKSLINAMKYLKQVQPLSNRDIILTHDAARINVTTDIINMNISVAQKTGCASTVLPLHDSIGEIKNTMKYLDRTHKYLIQTPQTIQYKH
jgi:2-C-methyl-D-erythritol 4-phosphate cytidylyltransferase